MPLTSSRTSATYNLMRGASGGVLRQKSLSSDNTAKARQSDRDHTDIEDGTHRVEDTTNLASILAENGDDSSHIVGPTLAEDNDDLEAYLSNLPDTRYKRVITRSAEDHRGSTTRPVLFSTVLRRPLGVATNQSLAASKVEIIEKLIEPCLDEVLNVFFQNANICFPIFHEASFRHTFTIHKQRISSALLANLYANALIYWNNSPRLRKLPCPDGRYAWVQANEALHSETFISPGISTVIAIVLNVAGRPSTSIFGNGGQLGTAIALSNALGLNRDPSTWNISPAEKTFRIRTWWLVIVHDRWCSLAYGTPLQIYRPQHDVPIPSPGDLNEATASPDQKLASTIFVALVSLTEVLGSYLQHIYHIDKDIPAPPASAMDFELKLDHWEASLANEVRGIVLRGTNLYFPGAPNLRLAYLAVKLLLRRVQIGIERQNNTIQTSTTEDSYFDMQAQRVAEDIVYFVKSLDGTHLRGFWMPVHAYTLTSATTYLLRSALRRKEQCPNSALLLAKDMVSMLTTLQDQYGWDLANNCIASCGSLLEKVESVVNASSPLASDFSDFVWPAAMDISNSDNLFGMSDGFFMSADYN